MIVEKGQPWSLPLLHWSHQHRSEYFGIRCEVSISVVCSLSTLRRFSKTSITPSLNHIDYADEGEGGDFVASYAMQFDPLATLDICYTVESCDGSLLLLKLLIIVCPGTDHRKI